MIAKTVFLFICCFVFFGCAITQPRKDRDILSAIEAGNIPSVKTWLAGGGDLEERLNTKVLDAPTPLQLAALLGYTKMCGVLIDHGARIEPVRQYPELPMFGDQSSALSIASMGGHRETVAFLLKKGANVNHQDAANQFTPLMAAVCWGDLRLYHGTGDRKTVIREVQAKERRMEKIVKLLLRNGANINLTNRLGESALDCGPMHPRLMRLLQKVKEQAESSPMPSSG